MHQPAVTLWQSDTLLNLRFPSHRLQGVVSTLQYIKRRAWKEKSFEQPNPTLIIPHWCRRTKEACMVSCAREGLLRVRELVYTCPGESSCSPHGTPQSHASYFAGTRTSSIKAPASETGFSCWLTLPNPPSLSFHSTSLRAPCPLRNSPILHTARP